MSNPTPTWLDRLLNKIISVGGVQQPSRGTIDFASGVTVTDDPGNDTTHLAVASGGAPGQTNLTLANGSNENVDPAGKTVLHIGGPSAAFAIGGFVAPTAPVTLVVINTTSQPFTINHEDVGSTAANRIDTQAGVAVTLPPRRSKATFTYDLTTARWVLHDIGLRMPFELNVRDFGAKGDGSTDDTAAIQAAVTAAIGSGHAGARVQFPTAPGTFYKVTAPITGTSTDGLVLEGIGGQALLVWIGGAWTQNQAMLSFSGAHRMHLKNLSFQANTPLDIGLDLFVTTGTDTVIASQCLIEHCYWINGTSQIEKPIAIGAHGNSGNNDFHHILNCRFEGYGDVAAFVADAQCYGVHFTDCCALGVLRTTTGSMANGSTTLATVTNNVFLDVRDIGKFVEIVDGSGNRLHASIVSVTDANHVVLSASWTFTSISPGAGTITYGSQQAINVGGSANWYGGVVANHLDADYFVNGSNSGGVIIDGVVGETSRAFLRTGGPSAHLHKMVTCRGVRWAGDGMVPEVTAGISFGFGGDLVLDSCHFVDPGQASPPNFQITFPNGTADNHHIIRDCVFGTSASATGIFGGSLFPGFLEGINQIVTAAGTTIIGQNPFVINTTSGTIHLDAGNGPVQRVLAAGDITFVIDNLWQGIGSNLRLHVLDNGAGPHALAWPAGIIWQGGQPPTTTIFGKAALFEFSIDPYSGVTFGRAICHPSPFTASAGTINTQSATFPAFLAYGRTFGTGGTAAQTIPIPNNTTCKLEVCVVGRATAASGTTVVGDSFASWQIVYVKNVSGTLTLFGTQPTAQQSADTSQTADTVVISVSGGNLIVTASQLGATNGGNIDWLFTSTMSVD